MYPKLTERPNRHRTAEFYWPFLLQKTKTQATTDCVKSGNAGKCSQMNSCCKKFSEFNLSYMLVFVQMG